MAKKNKRNEGYLSIRKKLIAAVAMLLVASFMVASSSYAWFTLSTAPEVTGIKTNVGANGSLEIALRTAESLADISANVGDTGKYDTWGNLVDLSDEKYGLQLISLYPAMLNIDATGKLATGAPLKTPTYGADGRVDTLEANTKSAVYDTTSRSFTNDGYGVQAIGTASGMTAQQLGYRNAVTQMKTSLALATKYARESLESSGSQLGTAVVGHAAAGDTDTNTYDISSVTTMIAKLKEANAALETHIKAYFEACLAKKAEDENPLVYAAVNIDWTPQMLSDVFTSGLTVNIAGTDYTVTAPTAGTEVKKAYDKYVAIATAIAAAETAFAGVADTSAATWTEVNAVFVTSGLVKISDMKVNGFEVSRDILTSSDFFNSVLANGITVQMGAGCGVYSDFAEVTGNYTVAVKLKNVTYGGLTVAEMDARMATTIENAPTIVVANELPGAPESSGSATQQITDYYGYIIDLAFRTNAKDSKLQLQTKPANRIYAQGGVEETMGKGSTMTFSGIDASFTNDQVKALMQCIRIVFASEGEIVGVGIIDADAFTTEGVNVTGNIRLVKFSIADQKLTLTTGTDGKYEYVGESTEVAELMALSQNVATALSVYVYLDGEKVQNKDVANGVSSMTGTLNLQFSSDAKLEPMNYTEFKEQGSTDDTNATVTDITLTSATSFTANGTLELTADLTPAEATDTITWAVVTEGTTAAGAAISDGNKLTATGAGVVKVSATAGGKTVTFNITVS